MGLIEFVQNAGARILGVSDDVEAAKEAESEAAETMGAALAAHVAAQQLEIRDLQVTFKNGTAAVFGAAASRADREKAVLALGNVRGVSGVQDWMTVEAPEPEAAFYTVQSGDTLSGIAKTHYGTASSGRRAPSTTSRTPGWRASRSMSARAKPCAGGLT